MSSPSKTELSSSSDTGSGGLGGGGAMGLPHHSHTRRSSESSPQCWQVAGINQSPETLQSVSTRERSCSTVPNRRGDHSPPFPCIDKSVAEPLQTAVWLVCCKRTNKTGSAKRFGRNSSSLPGIWRLTRQHASKCPVQSWQRITLGLKPCRNRRQQSIASNQNNPAPARALQNQAVFRSRAAQRCRPRIGTPQPDMCSSQIAAKHPSRGPSFIKFRQPRIARDLPHNDTEPGKPNDLQHSPALQDALSQSIAIVLSAQTNPRIGRMLGEGIAYCLSFSSSSRRMSFTTLGFARPCVAFIVSPTKKPISFSFPPR